MSEGDREITNSEAVRLYQENMSKRTLSPEAYKPFNFTVGVGLNEIVLLDCLSCGCSASARQGPVRMDLIIDDMLAHQRRCDGGSASEPA